MERRFKKFRIIKLLTILAVIFYYHLAGVRLVLANQPHIKPVNPFRTGEILLKLKNNPQIYKIKPDEKNFEEILQQYQNSPLTEIAEANQLFQASLIPDDKHFIEQKYHQQIFSLDAWDRTQGSSSVVVAVIDSGVDTDHPDLKDNIWRNVDEIAGDGLDNDSNGFIDDVNGWDFVTDTPDPRPKGLVEAVGVGQSSGPIGLNHGTVVAGALGARGNNREGIAGVNWFSRIMPVRILNSTGFGDTDDVVKGIDYAVDNGADIINLSFVGFEQSPMMDEAVKRAYNKDVLVVAAAGNNINGGNNLDASPAFPVCSGMGEGENILLGVAAVDGDDNKAKFSNFGSSCVDIAAPGVNIFSSQSHIPEAGLFEFYGDGWSGTSMATPLVSGAAALLKSQRPTLSNKELTEILIKTVDPIDSLSTGRLNIFRALLTLQEPEQTSPSESLNRPVIETQPPAGPPLAPVMLNLPTLVRAKELVVVPAGAIDSQVQIFDLESKTKIRSFEAFPFRFEGGLNLVSGDLNGDGFHEIIVAPGKGGSPQVRIFDSQGKLRGQFFAGAASLRTGASLALGDIDRDGQKEIIVGLGAGSEPEIRIFDYKGNLIRQFQAFEKEFRGGVNLAAADVDADGLTEIVVSSGPGREGTVRVFNDHGNLESEFRQFLDFSHGLSIAAGDLSGNGRVEIIVTPLAGGGPHIRIFNGQGKLLGQYFGFDNRLRGGAFSSLGNVLPEAGLEVILGAGKNAEPRVRVFDRRGQKQFDLLVYPESYLGGVRVHSLNGSAI